MLETLLGFLLVAAILGSAALLTQGLARSLYNRCPSCGALNARRRSHCRVCSQPILSG